MESVQQKLWEVFRELVGSVQRMVFKELVASVLVVQVTIQAPESSVCRQAATGVGAPTRTVVCVRCGVSKLVS